MPIRNEPHFGHGQRQISGGTRLPVRAAAYGAYPGDGMALASYPYMADSMGVARHDRKIADLLRPLWRRKALLCGVALLCGILTFLIASTLPARYSAQGLLAIENQPTYLPQLGMQMPQVPDVAAARSEAQILSSRALVEAAARKLELDKDPDLNPYLEQPGLGALIRGMVAAGTDAFHGLLEQIGLGKPRAIPQISSGDPVWEAVVDRVQQNLTVGTDGRSYVIYVGFDSANPQVSAGLVNTLMETFVGSQLQRSVSGQAEANSWLQRRSDDLQAEVEAADRKVRDYRTRHSLVETRSGTVSSQQLNEINTQLTLAQSARSEAEARYAQAQREARNGSANATYEVLNNGLIQSLREQEALAEQRQVEVASRLGVRHPTRMAAEQQLSGLRRQIRTETDKIVSSLAAQARVARTREQTLQRQLASQETSAKKSAEAEIGLRALEKEAETKRNVYQTFLATAQQTADPMRFLQSGAKIASTASVPAFPSGPKRGLYAFAGAAAGLMLAAVWILARAERRRSFESAAEVESLLGLPVLGAVPQLPRRLGGATPLVRTVIDDPFSAAAESLRGIRVAVIGQAESDSGGVVVLVTSAQPGEGKSSVATAMSAVSAGDGMKVLLIDSDLRRPAVRRMLGMVEAPSLSGALDGGRDLASLVARDQASGVDCLVPGDRVNSPGAVLGSVHWPDLLAQARRDYDLIVLDSPPVLRVADALVLARHADATLMVIDSAGTPRIQVQEAMRRFDDAARTVHGVVMSKVSGDSVQQSYYSGYAAA